MTLALATSCGEDDKPPRSREQFCRSWAEAACSTDVVDVCQAADREACIDSQDEFCHDLVPEDFADSNGDECIEAVKAAYRDADLDEDELLIVLRLGEPCNELVVGPSEEGDSCTENTDCDASAGLECVRKADSDKGTCQVPMEVGGGRDCEAAQKTCELGFYCDGENCLEAKEADEECTIQEECAEATFCSSAGVCTDAAAVGDACGEDYECARGICDEGRCTSRIRLARS